MFLLLAKRYYENKDVISTHNKNTIFCVEYEESFEYIKNSNKKHQNIKIKKTKKMRKDPIQKKAARSAAKRRIRREKERREQKRRMLLGLEPKGDSNRRVAAILNQIGQKKVV